jgi:hypothetical protein
MRWLTDVEGVCVFATILKQALVEGLEVLQLLLSFMSLGIDSRIGRALSSLHLRCFY